MRRPASARWYRFRIISVCWRHASRSLKICLSMMIQPQRKMWSGWLRRSLNICMCLACPSLSTIKSFGTLFRSTQSSWDKMCTSAKCRVLFLPKPWNVWSKTLSGESAPNKNICRNITSHIKLIQAPNKRISHQSKKKAKNWKKKKNSVIS